jgi:hypothetical protein
MDQKELNDCVKFSFSLQFGSDNQWTIWAKKINLYMDIYCMDSYKLCVNILYKPTNTYMVTMWNFVVHKVNKKSILTNKAYTEIREIFGK